MPIQWTGTITSQQKLAGVIQGEAGSDPAAQFAVASTMYNRMATPGPYIGGGSGDVSSVVLPSQFNGYNSSPNSNAMTLAGALMNGQAPPGGSTGNATFFAAPVQGNVAWAAPGGPLFDPSTGGTNIGGNYFSNRLGAPTSDFQAPQYTGAGTTLADGSPDNSSGLAADSGGTGGDYVTANPDGTANTGDLTQYQVAGVNAPAGASSTTPGSQSGGTGMTADAGQGTPVSQGLQQGTIDAITKWVNSVESAVGGAFSGALKSGQTAVGTLFGGVENWFIRAGLIVLGIILIAVALVVILWDHGGQQVAQQAVRVAAI
jgi:hypothetical protein